MNCKETGWSPFLLQGRWVVRSCMFTTCQIDVTSIEFYFFCNPESLSHFIIHLSKMWGFFFVLKKMWAICLTVAHEWAAFLLCYACLVPPIFIHKGIAMLCTPSNRGNCFLKWKRKAWEQLLKESFYYWRGQGTPTCCYKVHLPAVNRQPCSSLLAAFSPLSLDAVFRTTLIFVPIVSVNQRCTT